MNKVQTKRSLSELKSVYAPSTNTNNQSSGSSYNDYYPFWQMKTGERAVIRFLPDANPDNPRGFLVEKVTHKLTINGKPRTIPCLTMYGEECPICKISQEYYKAKDEVNGKKYWKNRQHIGQAIIVEDPLPANEETGEKHTGKLRYISISYQIYKILQDAFGSDDLEHWPDDYENGYDFIIKSSDQGKYASYVVGTKFASRPRALTDEELEVAYTAVDLSTLLPKHPGADKVQAMLEAEMNGVEYTDETPFTKQETNSPVVKSQPSTHQPSAPANTQSTKVDDDDDEDMSADVEDMLEVIKQRRRAAASAN